MNQQEFYNRYQRQLILKDFGMPAQQKLQAARVLVVGAGGLGCPVLQYLCGAGVGTIGIVDDDVVGLSNLHRQVLYETGDIGKPKANVAAEHLSKLNPDIRITQYGERLTNKNAPGIIADYDMIVDGSDNFPTRYLVNDVCVMLGKPFVYGAIAQYQGQLSVFNWRVAEGQTRAVHYRDVFAQQPANDEVFNCNEAGVIGVLPAIIGTMMAAEVVKMITGVGTVCAGELLTYDMLSQQVHKFVIVPDTEVDQLLPDTANELYDFEYDEGCTTGNVFEIEPSVFTAWWQRKDTVFVDVRNAGEQPLLKGFSHINIPLAELEDRVEELKQHNIVLFCASGKRSMKAVQLLNRLDDQLNVYSLKGGINNWQQTQSSLL
ncbi:HesA/MoeB/ThiF family protein [Niabella hibiscisoli]|uniref:HesA/MoeB/ThiF family protein n=1 Tax=Niabella hibiscisoli TaxID=1825928 RepID=UPI001F1122A2|nr:HesA/MoeB/ThiF family protein [Niabella hibiscisoli]MCH5717674.1 HesA/MoeB/ThiF family protein [Niabella hibiscisoli]